MVALRAEMLPPAPAIALRAMSAAFERHVLGVALSGVFVWGGGCFILPTRR